MSELPELFANNRAWAVEMLRRDPEFFRRLAHQQSPRYLWIGCSDSRVPANEIIGLEPGQVFVQRNVANLVNHSDLNCLSVLQYAVDVLKVEHVIVCGHYGCGGVSAAWRGVPLGLIDNWLRHVQDVASRHRDQLHGLAEPALLERLCELNVLEQASNVCRTTMVQEAWRRGQPVTVHGWVYGLKDGRLRDLAFSVSGVDQVEQAYQRAVANSGSGR
jgi:carbonic anhydrase